MKKVKKFRENQTLGIGQNQVTSPYFDQLSESKQLSKGNQNPNMLRKLLRGWLDHFFFCFARSKSSGGEPAHSNIGTGQWESPVHHHSPYNHLFLVVTIVKLLKSYFSPILVELLISSVAAMEAVVMPTVPTCDMSGL